jgi:hypothetical protein
MQGKRIEKTFGNSRLIKSVFFMTAFCLIGGLLPGACAKTGQDTIKSLAREYQSLRKRHKTQDKGKFDKNLDAWDGRLRVVMEELGKRLGTAGHSRSEIVRIIGKPDTVLAVRDGDGTKSDIQDIRLIYFWRGWHDYLFFVCQKDSIKKAEWYFAGE